MPSEERQELIETVAQKIQAKWSGGLINWDRLHGQMKKDYRDIAEVAVDAILAALQEPTEAMLEAGYAWDEHVTATETHPRNRGLWRAMLAASALGEQSE